MVQIVRKASLPSPADLPEPLAQLAAQALATSLREPRPAGFPLLFTKQWQLIEPAVAFLHEHAKDIFGTHVPLCALLKNFQDLQPRGGGLESGALDFFDVVHAGGMGNRQCVQDMWETVTNPPVRQGGECRGCRYNVPDHIALLSGCIPCLL